MFTLRALYSLAFICSAMQVTVLHAQYHKFTSAQWPSPATRDSAHARASIGVSGGSSSTVGGDIPQDVYFRSGVQQVYQEGKLLFEEVLGSSSVVHGVAMTLDTTFKVGSNTKLFTAFAIYKLHEMGLLDVSHDVSQYLEAADFDSFGFPGQTTWCPTIHGGDGSCEVITFKNLMSMSSGLVDGLNCNYAPGSWELEYCQHINTFQAYPGSMSKIVGVFINRPMTEAAGNSFQYTNENFMLLTYLVEKLSGVSYNDFLRTHVYDVIGLQATYYDPLEGALALTDKKLSEGYRDFHDLTRTSDLDSNHFVSAICSDEFNMGAFCGTGGMVSSAGDMHRWYHNLFVERNPALLSGASIDAILAPTTLTGVRDGYDAYFGQGVGVDVRHGESLAFNVYYTGNLICSATSIRLLFATPEDPPILSVVFRNHVVVNATQAQHSESLRAAAGTFETFAFETYQWESYGDSRALAEDLVNFFRENPTAWTAASGDDDDTSLSNTELAGVLLAGALGLLVGSYVLFAKMRAQPPPLANSADSGL